MGPMKVNQTWVKAMWKLFIETGDVQSHQGQRDAPPANRIIDELAAMQIIEQILDNPEYTLQEHHAEIQIQMGTTFHISTFCRSVHRLGFTRQRVRATAPCF